MAWALSMPRSWCARSARRLFDIIETTPGRLREVDGIGQVRAASILSAWAEQKAVREIMVFLQGHGVSTARAVRIFKNYGSTPSRS